ncbi:MULTISPECIES: hypothetical protein [Bacillales]|uniref:hypothetical protein n=1 Tax=Bacillales TaxID=1385 RepID=UPI0001788DE9|nr:MULTISPECIES: hypothetical protein [Paenibacillus]ACX67028.1 hypothetical protein GYMC10_4810 [Paenibacillus sp. Y412MC10]ETT68525.1 hypothetical protein C172_02292 [Paenibacillus sp. FSL H8-457]MCM3259495.1 hypothetical protein [Paenibacillus lautus]
MLVSILSCLLLFLLQACNGSEQPVSAPEVNNHQQTKPVENEAEAEPTKPAVNDNDRKAIGRDLLTKYTESYYKFTTTEAFDEGYLNELFDESMLDHPVYHAAKIHHQTDLKNYDKAEVDKIESESVEPAEEGGFIYKGTLTERTYHRKVEENDPPYFYSKKDFALHIKQDENGKYKFFDMSFEKRIYFPDM